MRLIDVMRARFALVFRRRAAEQRMNEEIAFHVEMEAERLVREEGLAPAEARRRAYVAFGGVEKHKEALRDGRGLGWLAGFSLDLKLGARMLIKYPGLTIVGVAGMSVAVAIGAVSFSAIYAVVDGSLPFADGDRIVAIQSRNVRTGEENRTHLNDLGTWREALSSVEELGAYRTIDRNVITRDGRSESMRVAEMSASGFRVAGVSPLMGRYLTADDERIGAPPVVVVGFDVWQTRLSGRADVVGQTLWLGATAHTIVGVMPKGFAFPINNRIWTPLRLAPTMFEPGHAPPIEVFGRLAAGASMADAQLQLNTIERRLAAADSATYGHVRARVVPYTRAFLESPEIPWVLHSVQVLISTLLLVIGTNVAVLVYARTASRAGEIAVRIALGASRGRVVAQLFAEALVLSALAAAVGLVIAQVALQDINAVLARMGGEQLPFWMHFTITPGVVAYVAGLAVLGAIIVGVVPAMKATGTRVHANLQELGSTGAAVRLGRSWTVMIVAQVAAAVIGIPFAATAVRGIRVAVDPRFATSEFLVARLFIEGGDETVVATRTVAGKVAHLGAEPRARPDDDRELTARFANLRAELVRRLSASPGIVRVVASSSILGDERQAGYEVDADPAAGPNGAPTNRGFRVNGVEPDYFDAFDVPILLGRRFTAGDATASIKPVIVNQSFVDKYLSGVNPLGRRVRPSTSGRRGDERKPPWQTIVGVVADFPTLSDTSLGLETRMFVPLDASEEQSLVLNVRVAGGDPARVTQSLRDATLAVSPSLRVVGVAPLVDRMNEAIAPTRIGLTALLLVVASVVILSAAGMYALMSVMVTRRRREIGIRVALGAGGARVIMSVLIRAVVQIGIGVAVGIAVLFLMIAGPRGGRLTTGECVNLLTVVGLFTLVGLFAAIGPARRALRIQPTEALRVE